MICLCVNHMCSFFVLISYTILISVRRCQPTCLGYTVCHRRFDTFRLINLSSIDVVCSLFIIVDQIECCIKSKGSLLSSAIVNVRCRLAFAIHRKSRRRKEKKRKRRRRNQQPLLPLGEHACTSILALLVSVILS
jgi:hypothetical protein